MSHSARHPWVLALTGGIGSGKSAVSRLLGDLGADVVDTDVISRQLTASGGGAIHPLREAFGAAAIDGTGALDRVAMRRLAFSDPSAKARLEAILHPMIRAEVDRQLASSTAPYVVLVVPLLVETGFQRQRAERVLVVDCTEGTQLQRVKGRDGLADAEVAAIMARQATRQERLAAADDVVVNEGSFDALATRVGELHGRYLAIAAAASDREADARK